VAEKKDLQVGQRVKFHPASNTALELTGKVALVHEDSDLVDVTAEADGKAVEVETTMAAHAKDVTPVADITAVDSSESSEEGGSRRKKRNWGG
jgi:hypothetical protein